MEHTKKRIVITSFLPTTELKYLENEARNKVILIIHIDHFPTTAYKNNKQIAVTHTFNEVRQQKCFCLVQVYNEVNIGNVNTEMIMYVIDYSRKEINYTTK